MSSGVFSILAPLLTTVYLTYAYFGQFYPGESSFLLFLCSLGVIAALIITLPLPKHVRPFYIFTPYFTLFCMMYNLPITLIGIIIVLIAGFILPKTIKRGKIIFTDNNAPVFITVKSRLSIKSVILRTGLIYFYFSMLLFITTCIFTTPFYLWQIRTFPIDISEKVLIGNHVIPSGNVTCTMSYNQSAIYVDSFIDVETASETYPSPALAAGLKEGDVITKINNQPAKKSDFISNGLTVFPLELSVTRQENDTLHDYTFHLTPIYSDTEKKFMIGITYYDSLMPALYSTVQTVSFTYPVRGYFAATAHSSENSFDDGADYVHLLKDATVKGRDEEGLIAAPGDYKGEVIVSSNYGTFGVMENVSGDTIPIAKKSEIRLGKATILSDFEGGINSYEAYVTGTYRIDSRDVICLIVTDERIKSAGGITRGMSGSPLIQNGKLIGALSNTDSDGYCAYATFAYDMAHEIYLLKDQLAPKGY